ncbi:hypothetical protein FHX64_002001 [Microbacter margulisiae]|uniref:Uncharacterized protein n=1 Tax=Microbacter margulisiae TaxID=1350067 RepID=A0A7W5H1P2_9PORP|nr:hypothetical protein [Microbacter margulisiae]
MQHKNSVFHVTKATLQKTEVTLQRDKSCSAHCRNGFVTQHKSYNHLFYWIKANTLTYVFISVFGTVKILTRKER